MSDTPLQGRLATLFILEVIIIWKHLFQWETWSCFSILKWMKYITIEDIQHKHFATLIIHCYVHSTMIIYTISFLSISGKPVSWAFLNPSVSPFRSSSNGLIVESSNPAVRLYRYDSYTGKVITIFISRNIQYVLW